MSPLKIFKLKLLVLFKRNLDVAFEALNFDNLFTG